MLVVFFVIALILALFTNQWLLKTLKDTTKPKEDRSQLVRWAAQEKPAIGGFSFFLLFIVASLTLFLAPNNNLSVYLDSQFYLLLITCTIGFAVGWIDDAYTMPASFKLMGQLLCGTIMILGGVLINISGNWGLDALFTMFWVVGIMNSINMLDNMDGITTTVSAVIVLTILLVLGMTADPSHYHTWMLIGVFASLLGFLYYNWSPAKMYMGDSGSQFLGAFFAFMSIVYLWNFREEGTGFLSIRQFLIPALAFMMPLIDTTTVFIRRIARGQSPFVGGRDHTTHHLAYCGLSDSQVGIFFLGASLLNLIIIYWMVNRINTWSYANSLLIMVFGLLCFGGMQFFYEIGKKRQQND